MGWQCLGDSRGTSTDLTGFSAWTLRVTRAHFLVFCLERRWSSSRAGCAGEAGLGRGGDTFPGHPGAPSTRAAEHFVSTGRSVKEAVLQALENFLFQSEGHFGKQEAESQCLQPHPCFPGLSVLERTEPVGDETVLSATVQGPCAPLRHVPLEPGLQRPRRPRQEGRRQVDRLTPAVFVAQVWEPPDVGQVHREADHREEEVGLLAPGLPILGLRGALRGVEEGGVSKNWKDGFSV